MSSAAAWGCASTAPTAWSLQHAAWTTRSRAGRCRRWDVRAARRISLRRGSLGSPACTLFLPHSPICSPAGRHRPSREPHARCPEGAARGDRHHLLPHYGLGEEGASRQPWAACARLVVCRSRLLPLGALCCHGLLPACACGCLQLAWLLLAWLLAAADASARLAVPPAPLCRRLITGWSTRSPR